MPRPYGSAEEGDSAGRPTPAARIADEVHMDPPPQAHIGVGHVPEYTIYVRLGQLMPAVWSERTAARTAPPRTASAAAKRSRGCTPPNDATR